MKAKDARSSILAVVEEIWNTYDVDHDGKMTREETADFIKVYMPEFKQGFKYSSDQFENIFNEIDDDGNGMVDKKELTEFILRLLQRDQIILKLDENEPNLSVDDTERSNKHP